MTDAVPARRVDGFGLPLLLAVLLTLTGCALPTSTPEPTSPTSAPTNEPDLHGNAQLTEQLDSVWAQIVSQHGDLDRPPLQIARYVHPDEWADVVVSCIVEAGFPAVVLADGGISFGQVPQAQLAQRDVANYTCISRYPTDPRYTGELDDQQLTALYAYQREVLIPCLESRGHAPAAPPTLQVFIDNYGTADTWDPWGSIAVGLSEADYYDLYEACPPFDYAIFGR